MKVAVIQMNSVKSIDKNLVDAHLYVQEAASLGARFIVLPEMFLCIGVKDQSEILACFFPSEGSDTNERAANHTLGIERIIGSWAKSYNVYILAGSIPYPSDKQSDKVYASSLLFSPQGNILTRYDKIHLFDVSVGDEKGSYCESDTFLPGREPKACKVDEVLLGMSICYDLRFPELYQHYQAKSCQMISVPSAFTYQTGKKHWEILLRARAIETQSFILAANQVGLHEDGRRTWGHSMIVSPSGDILAQVEGEKPGVALADLDFENQARLQLAMPLMKHKRL